jgi:hypothetical protein
VVANFAQHDHVRILAEKGFERDREGHPDLLVHLRLSDSVEVVFDRILDGGDVHGRLVKLAQGAVQGRGLS